MAVGGFTGAISQGGIDLIELRATGESWNYKPLSRVFWQIDLVLNRLADGVSGAHMDDTFKTGILVFDFKRNRIVLAGSDDTVKSCKHIKLGFCDRLVRSAEQAKGEDPGPKLR